MGLDFKGNKARMGAYGCYSNPDQNKAFGGDGTEKKIDTVHLSGWRERCECFLWEDLLRF